MRHILALLFFALFFAPIALAQEVDPFFRGNADTPVGQPDDNQQVAQNNCYPYEGFSVTVVAPIPNPDQLCPPGASQPVSVSDFVVQVVFTGLSSLSDASYHYCLKEDPFDCDDDDIKPAGNKYDEATGTLTFERLCGDGDNKLKESCDDDGSDWFHEGKTYRISLFDKDKEGAFIGREASFYITHYYPKVIRPDSADGPGLNVELLKKDNKLIVEIEGRNLQGNNNDKYNDYWIRLEGYDNDYKSTESCVFVARDGKGSNFVDLRPTYEASDGNQVQLAPGMYILKIKDGKNGNFQPGEAARCDENDFTYFYVPIRIGAGDTSGEVGHPIADPKAQEKPFTKLRPTPQPLCNDAEKNELGYCTKIPTALGFKINTEPALFVRDVFTVVLSVGGLLTIVFFIQAGYRLMTSAGNKEKVAAAREQMTSTIMGLIFIILSITILEFIGVNILRIPGFGN